MKVSEFLRQYQIGGQLPDDGGDEMLNFYAGWLIGNAYRGTIRTLDEARDMAIKAAEFIESRATGH
jgi:hypothetical protein